MQLMRSATSVAANYAEARRARSKAEFISKVGDAHREAGESILWLRYLIDSAVFPATRLAELLTEANELTAILHRSIQTARRAL